MSIFIVLLIFFWVTLVGVASAAFTLGGGPERTGMIIILVGSVVSAILGYGPSQNSQALDLWMLFSDTLVLFALGSLALRSARYWPLWATSFHAITVMTHVADLIAPNKVPTAYLILQGLWIYPMFVAILLGIYGHRQALRHGRY
jgi:hypothetical protein